MLKFQYHKVSAWNSPSWTPPADALTELETVAYNEAAGVTAEEAATNIGKDVELGKAVTEQVEEVDRKA